MGRAIRVLCLALVALSCGTDTIPPIARDVRLIDDGGTEIALGAPPRRIVSLVPSVTDAVVALGRGDRLVGRTRYDENPAVVDLPSVGGGIDPSLESLRALDPDLVIGWRSEGVRTLREALSAMGIPYYASAIEDTTDVFRTLQRLGTLLEAEAVASRLVGGLRDSLEAVAADARDPRPTVLYAIVENPPRTAGRDTFIGQLIEIAGGSPVFETRSRAWPQVSLESIVAADPDIVLVPVYDGAEDAVEKLAMRPGWRGLTAVRAGRVVGVPAVVVARPGPSMHVAAREIQRAILSVWVDP